MLKQAIKNIFGFLGFEIRKKIHAPLNHAVLYNSKANTDKFYADEKSVASYENETRVSFYREIIVEIARVVDVGKINSVADVSAGTGKLLSEFKQKYPHKKFNGFEFSDTALELCKKNCPDIQFGKIDLYKPLDKNFDLVLCVDTLEHLEHPEIAIANMLAMLNPQGNLFLVVPNGRYDSFEGHVHYWSPESFKLFLEKNNCAITYTKVWNKFNEQCAVAGKKLL